MFGQENKLEIKAKGGLICLYALIAVNIVIFLLDYGKKDCGTGWGLFPAAFKDGDYYLLFTHMFYHQELFHLLLNVYALYFFGSLVAPRVGAIHFLLLYLISGTGGGLLWLLFNWNSNAYALGASGSIMGISIACAMFAPNIRVQIVLIPITMKMSTMAIVYFFVDLFCEVVGRGRSPIAHLGHIGGFIAGYLYTTIILRKYVLWNPLAKLFGGLSESAGNYSMPRGWRMSSGSSDNNAGSPSNERGPVTQRELDYLLDKISKQGINSLTPDEMDRLRQAREQMRGNGR